MTLIYDLVVMLAVVVDILVGRSLLFLSKVISPIVSFHHGAVRHIFIYRFRRECVESHIGKGLTYVCFCYPTCLIFLYNKVDHFKFTGILRICRIVDIFHSHHIFSAECGDVGLVGAYAIDENCYRRTINRINAAIFNSNAGHLHHIY